MSLSGQTTDNLPHRLMNPFVTHLSPARMLGAILSAWAVRAWISACSLLRTSEDGSFLRALSSSLKSRVTQSSVSCTRDVATMSGQWGGGGASIDAILDDYPKSSPTLGINAHTVGLNSLTTAWAGWYFRETWTVSMKTKNLRKSFRLTQHPQTLSALAALETPSDKEIVALRTGLVQQTLLLRYIGHITLFK